MRTRAAINARRGALCLSCAALFALCSAPTQAFAGATLRGRLDLLNKTGAGQLGALTVLWLLAASTFVSEDLTCVAAGVLAAQGRVSLALAASGCLLGIYVGDLLLFLAGRFLGRAALARAPLKWVLKRADVERSSEWFGRRGAAVIMLSRFLPGTRVATYFAAGVLDTSLLKFALYFFVAAAVWTPMLVGLSALLGAEVINSTLAAGQGLLTKALLGGLVALVVFKTTLRLTSYKGRRLLVSRWRRITRWEFWPPWVFYPPVVAYVLWLGLKHRSLTLFTCANPAISSGGTIGESKMEILRGLSASAASQTYVARACLLPATTDAATRVESARAFMTAHGLAFPVVLKPDVGQRGAGVAVVRAWAQLREYLSSARGDTIIQEYAPGREFGVFYCRMPEEERGRIFSVTEKRFPSVKGDGASTLETLILRDERAVCMARAYFRLHRGRLREVPRAGESVQLVELGTHCRGAVFLDGAWVKTGELERAIDELCRGFEGFYFGRFDMRAASVEEFRRGRGFKVVELNGVTSEATHIYDPRYDLLEAYRTLFGQWRIAFLTGAQNRARGFAPTPVWTLARLAFKNFFGAGKGLTSAFKRPAGIFEAPRGYNT